MYVVREVAQIVKPNFDLTPRDRSLQYPVFQNAMKEAWKNSYDIEDHLCTMAICRSSLPVQLEQVFGWINQDRFSINVYALTDRLRQRN